MKFVYEYRTSDNVRHNGVIAASDREAAFALLKSQGIRPGFLGEAPGFFNKLFGKGKRWIAIVVLAIAASVATFFALTGPEAQSSPDGDIFDSTTRHQIIGDAAVIEKGIRTGWADVFALEGDRFLASFAVPGYQAAVRSTTEAELQKALSSDCPAPRPFDPSVEGSLERRQIVAVVRGMKKEISALLSSGWTLKEVGTALVKRQDREIDIFHRAENEIATAKKAKASVRDLTALWEKKNDELRILGIRLIPMPE